MKRIISVLLIVILAAGCLTIHVSAEPADSKISPAVRTLIAENSEGGAVVEISYHNDSYPIEGLSEQEFVDNTLAAQRELLEEIEAITYCEPSKLIFYNGTMLVGLPYSSIEAVAAFKNVDYIDLPHDDGSDLSPQQKMDDKTKIALAELEPDTKVSLVIWFAFNEHAYIGVPEPGDGCTHEEVDEYLSVMRSKKKAYISAKNQEFAEAIQANCEVENVAVMSYVPIISLTARLSEVEKLASMREVGAVYYAGVVYIPSDDPQSLEDKFADWMFKKNGVVRSDPYLAEIGLQGIGNPEYSGYREICSNDNWSLVYATTNMYEPWEYVGHMCLGNRVLSWYEPGACIIPYGYCVYNAAEDTFYPIERFVEPVKGSAADENGKPVSVILEPTISLDDYPGLIEALNEYDIGVVRGDADGDGETTVVDATVIQRYQADIIAKTGLDVAAADADGDGDTTILDATRIQRTVADLCSIDGSVKG